MNSFSGRAIPANARMRRPATLGPPGPPDSWVTRVVEKEYGPEAGWDTGLRNEEKS